MDYPPRNYSNDVNQNNTYTNDDYDQSQSTTMNHPEQFEDEPGYNNNNDPSSVYDHQQQRPSQPSYDPRYSIDENEDSYQQQQHHPPGNYRNNDDQYYEGDDEPSEQAPQHSLPTPVSPPPRQHKYSTANLREQGKWKKWCKILLLFLIMLAIMIGISMLFNHFFFGDTSDNGPPETGNERDNENATFAKDKQEIDSACGIATIAQDEGRLCKESCVPQYFHCCDPFDEFQLYNYTEPKNNSTNSTTNSTAGNEDDGKLTSDKYDIPEQKNLTFLDGYEKDPNEVCTFDMDVRGCMAYAKCHALAGQTDPAPANLPDVCSFERLQKDPDSCSELCQKLDCCYSIESDNCLAEKFDLCMDYAPCQNLRILTGGDPDTVLEIAPRTLDYNCYYQQPACTETCEKARCCSEAGDYSCFQNDFLSCITYSPCNNVTEVNINITQQFSHVPQPSIDLVYACDKHKDNTIIEPSDRSCDAICTDAACCWLKDPSLNCFHLDPLGCLAYEAQCQALLE